MISLTTLYDIRDRRRLSVGKAIRRTARTNGGLVWMFNENLIPCQWQQDHWTRDKNGILVVRAVAGDEEQQELWL